MNKQDLIGAVADSSGLSKTDAAKAVEGVFDAITGALKKGSEAPAKLYSGHRMSSGSKVAS